jgi:hypothetical protein
MLASLSGTLALAVGLAVMLLPLLSPELSRPRDAAWGAVVLLLGLTLVTSADRLTGAPMLAVLCGGLLIGRLGGEVMQLRWRQLTPEEQQGLASSERWQRSGRELAASLAVLSTGLSRGGSAVADSLTRLTAALRGRSQARAGADSKRWVRPEAPAEREQTVAEPDDTVVVSSFAEIDALIDAAATQATPEHSEAG